ncbi:FAD/NAD(P)-binding protein [Nonomuraea sp. SMC257]|uniref:FAD/NAD(P)-binding protein n=1 Tax=Nonomuraea montanisoli TaxID=2741721 RepID=A0A7Y6M275_9ACTN|nr:FAD/NAD(P)-binding protein [Nonomuraea montanisoli]NUW31892.1 FAD/NAD(P)-binding protein [Nonomuraea montanisoli]
MKQGCAGGDRGRAGTVVVVGAGPAGACVVRRLRACLPEAPGDGLDVHVVDPYPSHAFERTVRAAPGAVRVHLHRERAAGLTGGAGRQRVELSGGTRLEADAVVLALGDHGAPPSPAETEQAVFAARHGLLHVPAGQAADPGPGLLPAGEPVLVRGVGSAFTRLLTLLVTERGGRFAGGRGGEPVYLPSGDEPLLYVGSRRGVPHQARPGHRLAGPPPGPPRFLTRDTPPEELRRAVAKELAYAYYRELFTAHPARTRVGWDDFEAVFAEAEWGGREMRALVTRSVPRFADRLNLDRLERPLHGMRFGDLAGLQRWMHGYLAAALERRADPAHGADLALVHRVLSVRAVLAGREPDPWFERLCGFLAGGPPVSRLAELRALARAGVVTFLGAGMRVDQDERSAAWRASGATVPGAIGARALVEARLPELRPSRAADPLLSALRARGECRETTGLLDVRAADRRLVTGAGDAHPRRFALGPWTAVAAHPGDDGALPGQADAVARAVLAQTAASLVGAAA